jgi:hypothetical protein
VLKFLKCSAFCREQQAFWQKDHSFILLEMLWELLPTMLELKKVANLFTPVGMLAAYLGVPIFVITLLFWLLRKVFERKI